MTKKDYQIERIYSGIIANFINYGSPSYRGYEWKPWTPEKRNYFLIGKPFLERKGAGFLDFDKNLRMPGERSGYYSKADVFWNKYLPKWVGDHFLGAFFSFGKALLEIRKLYLHYFGKRWFRKVGGFTTVHKFPPRTDIIVYPELMDYIRKFYTKQQEKIEMRGIWEVLWGVWNKPIANFACLKSKKGSKQCFSFTG